MNIPNLISTLLVENIGFETSYEKDTSSMQFKIYGETPDVSTDIELSLVTGELIGSSELEAFDNEVDFMEAYRIWLEDVEEETERINREEGRRF